MVGKIKIFLVPKAISLFTLIECVLIVQVYVSQDGPLFITTSRQGSFNSLRGTTLNSEVKKEASDQDYQTPNSVLPCAFGSTSKEDMRYSQESIRSPYASNLNGGTSATKAWLETYSWQSECANPNLQFQPSSQNGSGFLSNLPQKLDAAETTIKELREEALTWERHSHKLNVEVETLKQQLATELKSGAELRVRISSLKSENERLRLELGQRRASEVAFNRREDVDSFWRLELDKSKQLVTALQEENTYEKEMSANLHIQLQKTQESNNELVSVATELEAALELRNKEITSLDELNQELNEQLNKTQELNAELLQRVHEQEVMASAETEMEEQIQKQGSQPNHRVQNQANDELCEVEAILKKEMEVQNVDCKELTSDQNTVLHELCKGSGESDATVRLIAVLEAMLQVFLQFETSGRLSTLLSRKMSINEQAFSSDAKMQVTDREHWKHSQKQQFLEGAVGELIHNNSDDDIDDNDMIIEDNLELVEGAGAQEFGDNYIEKYSRQTSHLEADCERTKEKSREFFRNLKSLAQALQRYKENTDASLHSPHQEVSKTTKQQYGYTAELPETYESIKSCKVLSEVLGSFFDIEKLVQELAEYRMSEKNLHTQLLEARTEIVTLDTELQASIEQKRHYQSCLNELEVQIQVLQALLQDLKLEYESSNLQVEIEKTELQEKFDKACDDSRAATEKSNDLVSQMEALTTSNEILKRRALALEDEKEELKAQVGHFEKENAQLSERIVVFEAESKCMCEEEQLEVDLKTIDTLGSLEQTGNWQLHGSSEDIVTSAPKIEETELQQAYPSEEDKHYALLRQDCDDESHHDEDDKTHTEFIREIYEELLEAVTECSLLKEKGSSLNVKKAEVQRGRESKEQSLQAEIASLYVTLDGFEQRENEAEERMLQMQWENAAVLLVLQGGLQELTRKLALVSDAEQKLAEALLEATDLRAEKAELEVNAESLQMKLMETEEQLFALQKKIENVEAERHEASKCLLITNSSQMLQDVFLEESHETQASETPFSHSNCEQMLLMREPVLGSSAPEVLELRLELKSTKHRMDQLKHELNDANVSLKAAMTECKDLLLDKTDAVEKLSDMMMEMSELKQQKPSLGSQGHLSFSSSESAEILDLRQNLKLLKEYVESKENELNGCKIEFLGRESELCDRIEQLELSNLQLAAGRIDPGVDQLTKEENELLQDRLANFMDTAENPSLLEKVVSLDKFDKVKCVLDNELLKDRLSKFMKAAKNPYLLEKIVSLEIELADAVDANKMYKLQLAGVFEKQQSIKMAALKDFDAYEQIRKDLSHAKKRASELEEALHDMTERYACVTLRLAETETARGELLITLRDMRSAKIT